MVNAGLSCVAWSAEDSVLNARRLAREADALDAQVAVYVCCAETDEASGSDEFLIFRLFLLDRLLHDEDGNVGLVQCSGLHQYAQKRNKAQIRVLRIGRAPVTSLTAVICNEALKNPGMRRFMR